MLDQDLKEIKQQHQDATTQGFNDFITQLSNAMQSPDAALALYQQSGGAMPATIEVKSHYDNETPDEKANRLAQDNANLAKIAAAAQIQCGLMRFAVLLINTPDQKGLQEDWIAWLKSTPQIYIQIKDLADINGKSDSSLRDLKKTAVRDSVISNALGFHGWGDGSKGDDKSKWTVKMLPALYRSEVLEPLRMAHSPDVLAAWDTYISMKNADQPDDTKWAQDDYPPLAFDRACDDYAVTPATEKLQAIIAILKANPNLPNIDDLMTRAHELIDDYRKRHSPAPTPAATTTPTDTDGTKPNVTVSTQGDMTVVTTHYATDTNGGPVNPTPPPNPPATNAPAPPPPQ